MRRGAALALGLRTWRSVCTRSPRCSPFFSPFFSRASSAADKCTDENATEKFQGIANAYQRMQQPESDSEEEGFGGHRHGGFGDGFMSAEELFAELFAAQMFGGGGGGPFGGGGIRFVQSMSGGGSMFTFGDDSDDDGYGLDSGRRRGQPRDAAGRTAAMRRRDAERNAPSAEEQERRRAAQLEEQERLRRKVSCLYVPLHFTRILLTV